MKKKYFRIPDKLADAIERDAKDRAFASENDYITKSLEHFLKCKRTSSLEGPKLMRSPIDTHCADPECKTSIRFGAWCYYHPETGALCLECGVKRGMSNKHRVKQLIESFELKEGLSALKKEVKTVLQDLSDIKQHIDLYKLGERHTQLQEQKEKLYNMIDDYLKNVATQDETKAITQMQQAIFETTKLQEEIREKIRKGLLERMKQKKKKKKKVPQ